MGKENRNSSDSKTSAVPILDGETEQPFKDRLREVIGDRTLVSFAKACGFSDSLLGSYLRGEKLPGFDNLISIAEVGGASIDWLATGRLPKVRERRPAAAVQAQSQNGELPPFDGRRDMLEAVLRVMEHRISTNKVDQAVIDAGLKGAPAWLEAARDYPDLQVRLRSALATLEFMSAAGLG